MLCERFHLLKERYHPLRFLTIDGKRAGKIGKKGAGKTFISRQRQTFIFFVKMTVQKCLQNTGKRETKKNGSKMSAKSGKTGNRHRSRLVSPPNYAVFLGKNSAKHGKTILRDRMSAYTGKLGKTAGKIGKKGKKVCKKREKRKDKKRSPRTCGPLF